MKRQSDRAGVRQRYGDLFDQVAAALFAADPMGINFGSNADEYEPEASTIIPRLSGCRSPQDVQVVIHEEFVAWFDLDAEQPAARSEHYSGPAGEIWALWQRCRASHNSA